MNFQHLVARINRKRSNPQWLTRIAQRIGALRYHMRRKRELRRQNFSGKAIRGILG